MKHLRSLLPLALLGTLGAAEAVPGKPASSLLLDRQTLFADTAELAQYASRPALAGRLAGLGNGPTALLMQDWAAEFSVIYPDVACDIASGGEAAGLPQLLAGSAAMVAMRRPLTAQELADLTARFGHPPLQLAVAHDSAAVLVALDNPIPRLSMEQMESIYARSPRGATAVPETWGDLGVPPPLDKTLIVRCALTPAINRQFSALVGGGEFRYDLRCSLVPGMMLRSIAAEPGAIGFASMMFATAGTRAVPLVGADGRDHLPSYAESVAGTYPLGRSLTLVLDPAAGPLAIEFARFAISRRGQRIAGLLGAFPLDGDQQRAGLAVLP
jgi:phosphate transport system substrate-binding protein